MMFNYKIIFALLLFVFVYKSNAVTEKDTVELGASYVNEIWYNMLTGDVLSANKDNWDIAFQIHSGGAGVWVNAQKGMRAWVVPGKTEDDWSKPIDTTGMDQTWEYHTNSEDSWNVGSLNRGLDGYVTNGDFGWGKYNVSTHIIYGNKIFVIKVDKKTYKKFWIETDDQDGYTFWHANLDGSEEAISKANIKDFPGKNFAYFSFSNTDNKAFNREPDAKDWNIVFGKYEGLIPDGQGGTMTYYLTGVRQNYNTPVAKLKGVSPKTVDAPAFNGDNFLNKITVMGADWKTYNTSTSQYEIPTDLVYFVSVDSLGTKHPKIYRIFFTGFSGSEKGQIIFEKEQMPASVIENDGKPLGSFTIYPNVISSNDNLNIVYELFENTQNIKIAVYSSTGDLVYTSTENALPGLNTININNLKVSAGMYLVTFDINGKIGTEKLIVK